MIVYNITLKIDPGIEKEWLDWMKREHIPEVMALGQFTEHKMYRLLDQNEEDGITYVVQYFSQSLGNYQSYINKAAPLLREKAMKKWGDKFIAFRTVMEVVN